MPHAALTILLAADDQIEIWQVTELLPQLKRRASQRRRPSARDRAHRPGPWPARPGPATAERSARRARPSARPRPATPRPAAAAAARRWAALLSSARACCSRTRLLPRLPSRHPLLVRTRLSVCSSNMPGGNRISLMCKIRDSLGPLKRSELQPCLYSACLILDARKLADNNFCDWLQRAKQTRCSTATATST